MIPTTAPLAVVAAAAYRRARRLARTLVNPPRLVNTLLIAGERNSEVVRTQPRHLTVFSTDRCNLRCRWCIAYAPGLETVRHDTLPDMDLLTFRRVLDRLPTVEDVSFAGQGEPLLNTSLPDMLTELTARGLAGILVTNGILLDSALIGHVLRNAVRRVDISLKGHSPSTFAAVTGQDASLFDRQVEASRALVAAKKRARRVRLDIRASFLVSACNVEAVSEMLRLAEKLGFDSVLLHPLAPSHDLVTGADCLFADDPKVRDALAQARRLRWRLNVEWPVLLRRQGFTRRCLGFIANPCVDAAGNVSGCMRVLSPRPEYGNIFATCDIMNLPHFREARRLFQENRLPDRCRVCVEMSR